jgi:hypothetical protein
MSEGRGGVQIFSFFFLKKFINSTIVIFLNECILLHLCKMEVY